jgi:hypothetical protein
LKYGQSTFRHVPQLSGNGREDRHKGECGRYKSWDSEIVIGNQKQKADFASRALKKEVAVLRRGERVNTRQSNQAEQKRRDREAARPTIR